MVHITGVVHKEPQYAMLLLPLGLLIGFPPDPQNLLDLFSKAVLRFRKAAIAERIFFIKFLLK